MEHEIIGAFIVNGNESKFVIEFLPTIATFFDAT